MDLQKLNSVAIPNTSSSLPAASAKIINQEMPHSIVVALRIREDGKIWTGTTTFAASKPIEVELLHMYQPILKPDEKHEGTAQCQMVLWNTNCIICNDHVFEYSSHGTDKPYSAGSFTFAGTSAVFNKTVDSHFQ